MLFQFSEGRNHEYHITSIVSNRKVRLAAPPTMPIPTLLDITVNRRNPPIGNLSYIAMFDRIEMQIIKMPGKIGLIADSIFP
ncbi:glycosyl transferase, partial [Neisseria meningitidis]|nr:glycosyl transferase [Neisseria meningitidis]